MIPGEDLRDEALQVVGDNANPSWKDAVHEIVSDFPRETEFTTDRVWWHLERRGLTTKEPRAMGAVMKKLLNDGIITQTGEYVRTTRPQAHARPIPVYRKVA